MAYHDILTGLYNRASFLERMKALTSKSKRHNLPLSLMELDLDGFKLINDTFGHGKDV